MFTDPLKNLKAFDIREDMIVADLGAGTGFYSVLAGEMVPKGKVYAIEIQKDFVTTIQNKAKDACLNNINCLWGNIEKVGGTKIKDSIVHRVIASNILFQVENKEKFLEEIKRILHNEGQVLLIDWLEGESSLGPKGANMISKDDAKTLFEKKGFIFERDIDTGGHHYGMIFRT